jgi:hypothetical protein
MKKFILDLLSANSPLSSKRFAGLVTLFSCIILAFTAASQSKWITPEFMYNGLLLVVAGLFGFNMAESIFKKSDSKVAEAAKDIPQEDKPKDTDETPEAEDKVN